MPSAIRRVLSRDRVGAMWTTRKFPQRCGETRAPPTCVITTSRSQAALGLTSPALKAFAIEQAQKRRRPSGAS
jgi:hypothetical protein